MRNAPLALGSGALVLLAAVLAIAGLSAGVVSAQPASTMGLDLNTTGNTSTAIPSIQQCARIDENGVQDQDETGIDTITVDFVVQGVPAFNDQGDADPSNDTGGIIGYQFNIDYDPATFTIDTAAATSGPPPDATFILNRNAGSTVSDISEPTPDNNADTSWLGGALDLGIPSATESGDGVLHRLTISTEAGAVAGQYILNLSNHAHLDAQGTAHIPAITLIGNITVNQACSGTIDTPTPTPTSPPTPTPEPTPSPSPTPTPSPTPSPTPTPCQTNCPTPSPTPSPTRSPSPAPGATGAAGTATPTRAATPRALPPTGSSDDGGLSAPIVLGAASVLTIAMALGGYEITRRLKREV